MPLQKRDASETVGTKIPRPESKKQSLSFMSQVFQKTRQEIGIHIAAGTWFESCKIKKGFFPYTICTARPAAMPHIMHDTKCIAAVVPPAPYYKLRSCGFNSTLLIIKDASQSCRIPCREKDAALLSFIFQSSDRWHPLQKLAQRFSYF